MGYPKRTSKVLSITEVIPKLVTPLLKSHGSPGLSVIFDWKRIVDHPFDVYTKPIHVKFTPCAVGSATLVLEVLSAYAPEVHHKQLMLIDRINSYYGYKLIGKIQIKQGHFKIKKDPVKTLSTDEKETIQKEINTVRDESLAQSLQNLGESLSLKEKSP